MIKQGFDLRIGDVVTVLDCPQRQDFKGVSWVVTGVHYRCVFGHEPVTRRPVVVMRQDGRTLYLKT